MSVRRRTYSFHQNKRAPFSWCRNARVKFITNLSLATGKTSGDWASSTSLAHDVAHRLSCSAGIRWRYGYRGRWRYRHGASLLTSTCEIPVLKGAWSTRSRALQCQGRSGDCDGFEMALMRRHNIGSGTEVAHPKQKFVVRRPKNILLLCVRISTVVSADAFRARQHRRPRFRQARLLVVSSSVPLVMHPDICYTE